MPVNLFETNSDHNAHVDFKGLNNSQVADFTQYGLNEDRPFSSGADLSLISPTNGDKSIGDRQYYQGVDSSRQSLDLEGTNDYLTGTSDKYVVDAWSSSTVPNSNTSEPIKPLSATPTSTDNSFVQRVVDLTNTQRTQAGLQPLRLNSKLNNIATAHSEDMAQHDYFSHNGLDGSTVGDRAKGAGYQFSSVGENIAAGYTTPEDVVQGWMNSPGHRANILNPNYQEIGVGYYYLANDTGKVNYHSYWTEDFGTSA